MFEPFKRDFANKKCTNNTNKQNKKIQTRTKVLIELSPVKQVTYQCQDFFTDFVWVSCGFIHSIDTCASAVSTFLFPLSCSLKLQALKAKIVKGLRRTANFNSFPFQSCQHVRRLYLRRNNWARVSSLSAGKTSAFLFNLKMTGVSRDFSQFPVIFWES